MLARIEQGVVDAGEDCDDGNANEGDAQALKLLFEEITTRLPGRLDPTATVFALIVKSKALVLSSAMYSQTRATPGV